MFVEMGAEVFLSHEVLDRWLELRDLSLRVVTFPDDDSELGLSVCFRLL